MTFSTYNKFLNKFFIQIIFKRTSILVYFKIFKFLFYKLHFKNFLSDFTTIIYHVESFSHASFETHGFQVSWVIFRTAWKKNFHFNAGYLLHIMSMYINDRASKDFGKYTMINNEEKENNKLILFFVFKSSHLRKDFEAILSEHF